VPDNFAAKGKGNMPKDPKRNIQSYQVKGGDLNEFEFAKNQNEMVEEHESPFNAETQTPSPTPAQRVAEVTAEAHKTVEKRKSRSGVERRKRPQARGQSKTKARQSTKTSVRAGAKKGSKVKRGTRKRAANR
jgi:hypothetical protein